MRRALYKTVDLIAVVKRIADDKGVGANQTTLH